MAFVENAPSRLWHNLPSTNFEGVEGNRIRLGVVSFWGGKRGFWPCLMPAPNWRVEVNEGSVVPRNPDRRGSAIVGVLRFRELQQGSLRSREGRPGFPSGRRPAGPARGAISAGAGA